jgi:O-antigen/teichoic acid export membrane protein
MKMAAFINFPIMLALILVSEPLIGLVLTEKWLPAVPYLQVMCIGGLLGPLQSLSLSVLTAKGHSRLFLKLDILKKVVTVITVFITYRWGVIAIIYGGVFLSYFSFYVNFYFTGKILNFSFRKQLLDLLPYFIIALVMAVFMYVTGYFLPDSYIIKLIVQSFTGIVIYMFLSKMFKLEAYNETMIILMKLKLKLTKSK